VNVGNGGGKLGSDGSASANRNAGNEQRLMTH
jgi:hypothetical protein